MTAARIRGASRQAQWPGPIVAEPRSLLMSKIVAGAVIKAGECGEDDITSANLDQMAATLETRPPTDDDRRELVKMLRWLAKMVRELEAGTSGA